MLRDLSVETSVAFRDDDILDFAREAQLALVPIDAPLSLPKGRRTIHDRSGKHLRECDRDLLRYGIRFFPVTLGPMHILTERGLVLKAKLNAMRYQTVECYPGATQDLWGIPRQHQDRLGLLTGLQKLGLRGLRRAATSDELDAATAALVGRWFFTGQGLMIDEETGILIPAVLNQKPTPR